MRSASATMAPSSLKRSASEAVRLQGCRLQQLHSSRACMVHACKLHLCASTPRTSLHICAHGPPVRLSPCRYLDKRGVPLAAVQVQYSLLRCRRHGGVAGPAWPGVLRWAGLPHGAAPCMPSYHRMQSSQPDPHVPCPRSRGPDQAAVKAACDDLGVALIAYSPLALGGLRVLSLLPLLLAMPPLRCTLRYTLHGQACQCVGLPAWLAWVRFMPADQQASLCLGCIHLHDMHLGWLPWVRAGLFHGRCPTD